MTYYINTYVLIYKKYKDIKKKDPYAVLMVSNTGTIPPKVEAFLYIIGQVPLAHNISDNNEFTFPYLA